MRGVSLVGCPGGEGVDARRRPVHAGGRGPGGRGKGRVHDDARGDHLRGRSVAFDHYNVFAASPAALLRAPVRSRIGADGRFGSVVSPSSAAWADAQVEVQVTDLSLDCRTDGRRRARAALALDVVKAGRGPRTVALQGAGAGEADAAEGDYARAFSSAVDAALAEALKSLKAPVGEAGTERKQP